jgi:hypothetical protein
MLVAVLAMSATRRKGAAGMLVVVLAIIGAHPYHYLSICT